MTNTKKSYKIQNPKGLFSTGGAHPEFSSTGKTWSSLHNLQSHLGYIGNVKSVYSDCKIVEVVEVINETEEFLLHKLSEEVIVGSSIRSPLFEFPEIVTLLHKFVMDGTCYSTDFKEYITERKALVVNTLVPDYIIENFDIMHNKGINGCSESELAAIILTATPVQQREFNL